MNKETINGVILVLSCQKYKYTRLKEFKMKKDNYNGWKVVYILGDLTIKNEYNVEDNIITLKCEDSYLHLLKKLVLSIKYLLNTYDIKEGIVRCGDDLYLNEDNLIKFLVKKNKEDYIGNNWFEEEYSNPIIDEHTPIKIDPFMVNYYKNHTEDFDNPLHNLKGINLEKYNIRPNLPYASGTLYYISKKCCQLIVNHMEKINYNIFELDNITKTYPYQIEDCGISFILCLNKIPLTLDKKMVKLHSNVIPDNEYISIHTNRYRDIKMKKININKKFKIDNFNSESNDLNFNNFNENVDKKFINRFINILKKCKKSSDYIIYDNMIDDINDILNTIPIDYDLVFLKCKKIKNSYVNNPTIEKLNNITDIDNFKIDSIYLVSSNFVKLFRAYLKYMLDKNLKIDYEFNKFLLDTSLKTNLKMYLINI